MHVMVRKIVSFLSLTLMVSQGMGYSCPKHPPKGVVYADCITGLPNGEGRFIRIDTPAISGTFCMSANDQASFYNGSQYKADDDSFFEPHEGLRQIAICQDATGNDCKLLGTQVITGDRFGKFSARPALLSVNVASDIKNFPACIPTYSIPKI